MCLQGEEICYLFCFFCFLLSLSYYKSGTLLVPVSIIRHNEADHRSKIPKVFHAYVRSSSETQGQIVESEVKTDKFTNLSVLTFEGLFM